MGYVDFIKARGPVDSITSPSVASANTIDISRLDGNTVVVTGTTTITSLGTAAHTGEVRTIIFSGILTLTHSSSLNLPGNTNLTTAPGDAAVFLATDDGWRCIKYQRSDGTFNLPAWEDLAFPLVGRRIDVSSGRLDYDYFNGTLNFNSNARYPEEPVSMSGQMPHSWVLESAIHPHFHWFQTSSSIPNWLLAYRILPNGEALTIETDFSNHTLSVLDTHLFTYTSGVILQISSFPDIAMSNISLSACAQFVIFRDTANVSGLFSGADPIAGDMHGFEFDAHYNKDREGSRQEYVK